MVNSVDQISSSCLVTKGLETIHRNNANFDVQLPKLRLKNMVSTYNIITETIHRNNANFHIFYLISLLFNTQKFYQIKGIFVNPISL